MTSWALMPFAFATAAMFAAGGASRSTTPAASGPVASLAM